MPLRRRLSLVAAAAVAVAVIIAAAVSYLVVRNQLRGQVDSSLQAEAQTVGQTHSFRAIFDNLYISPQAGGPAPYAQLINSSGQIAQQTGRLSLTVTDATRLAAKGDGNPFLSDVQLGGSHLREITIPLQITDGYGAQTAALQIARPLDGVDKILANLQLVLLLVLVGGIALAALLGRIAARRVLRPLAEVTHTAELIGETDDLSQRIDVHTDDEVGTLANRFNAMLERLQQSRSELDASVLAQRQLVADASHELRTPVTSLRTNVEVLLESDHLDADDRRRLLADVVEQSEELTGLVGDLIELARGDLPSESIEDVRLDRVVEEAVARSRRNAPEVTVEADIHRVSVEGAPERLSRAINNLLDNAARHSPTGGVIEVGVDRAGVRVRDHGNGIGEEDLPHVFDRFYRGANSRGRQGSGLGLAIVRQVAEQHGGSVTAANARDGGAVFTIHLPGTESPRDEADASEDRVSAPLF